MRETLWDTNAGTPFDFAYCVVSGYRKMSTRSCPNTPSGRQKYRYIPLQERSKPDTRRLGDVIFKNQSRFPRCTNRMRLVWPHQIEKKRRNFGNYDVNYLHAKLRANRRYGARYLTQYLLQFSFQPYHTEETSLSEV